MRKFNINFPHMKRNISLWLLFAFGSLASNAQHPFKYDNTVYKAVYLNEAFHLMDSIQNYLLLDVRSPGEYADTSRATALNIGRFKGSKNISIDSIPAHLAELKKFIDQPVFVYCSHSQRSRRVSKLLAENGFKKVYNINGGMTLVNESDETSFPYKNKVLATSTMYENIDPMDAVKLIDNTPGLVIIDIRTEQEFASKDTILRNNMGHLKNAINIPQDVFAVKIDSYKILNNRSVLLYDLKGINSMDVVDILRSKGFTLIYNLFGGLESILYNDKLNRNIINQLLTDPPAYQMLDPKACIDLLIQQPNLVILDTRPSDEFNNSAKKTYLNLGQIKGAIPVQSPGSLELIIQQKDKSTVFLIYGSNSDPGVWVCQELIKKGFQHVNFLGQGLYNFVWSTANIEDCKEGKKFLINHEELY